MPRAAVIEQPAGSNKSGPKETCPNRHQAPTSELVGWISLGPILRDHLDAHPRDPHP